MIKFNKYTYEQLYNDITRFGDYKEAEVEDAYKLSYIISSLGALRPIKAKNTDGIISYISNSGKEYLFIQETKNGKRFKNTSCSLSKQLGQAVYYMFDIKWNRPSENLAGFLLNTENFFGFIKIKDLQPLLDKLEPLYKVTKIKSACHISEDKTIINEIKSAIDNKLIDLHIIDLNSNTVLSNIYNKAFN